MSTDSLKSLSRVALEKLAKKRGIAGISGLDKAALIKALSRSPESNRSKGAKKNLASQKKKPSSQTTVSAKTGAAKAKKPISKGARAPFPSPKKGVTKATRSSTKSGQSPPLSAEPESTKPPAAEPEVAAPNPNKIVNTRRRDLSSGTSPENKGQNFLTASACDSHWIRAHWQLSRDSVQRAEARLGPEWHRSVPVLRLFRIHSDDSSAGKESFARDLVIDSDANTWYIPVPDVGRSFRVHIGYRGSSGTYFSIAKSAVCYLPKTNLPKLFPASSPGELPENGVIVDSLDSGDDSSPSRPLGFSTLAHFGPAATQQRVTGEFHFKLATEIIIHGSTRPGSALSVQGEQVALRDDGSFTLRINQPEGRQVIGFTAMDPRGNERRMIVLAMERNTKELERQYFDGGHSEMSGE